jgi:hypothetical protein
VQGLCSSVFKWNSAENEDSLNSSLGRRRWREPSNFIPIISDVFIIMPELFSWRSCEELVIILPFLLPMSVFESDRFGSVTLCSSLTLCSSSSWFHSSSKSILKMFVIVTGATIVRGFILMSTRVPRTDFGSICEWQKLRSTWWRRTCHCV